MQLLCEAGQVAEQALQGTGHRGAIGQPGGRQPGYDLERGVEGGKEEVIGDEGGGKGD